jgi:hypothetical protein
MTTKNALHLWKLPRFSIGYSHSTMTSDERMQRESTLIATIRRKLPDFVKACADETELVLLHQDAFAAAITKRTNTRSSAWRSSMQGSACDREEPEHSR